MTRGKIIRFFYHTAISQKKEPLSLHIQLFTGDAVIDISEIKEKESDISFLPSDRHLKNRNLYDTNNSTKEHCSGNLKASIAIRSSNSQLLKWTRQKMIHAHTTFQKQKTKKRRNEEKK